MERQSESVLSLIQIKHEPLHACQQHTYYITRVCTPSDATSASGAGEKIVNSLPSVELPESDQVLAVAEMHMMPGHLLRRMHQASQAIFDGEMARRGHDITPVQYAALSVISERPGLDQATLATAIAFDRATTGGVIDRLESKGLVRREVDRADRRARRLYIEKAGEELFRTVTPFVRDVQDRMLQGLDPAERKSLLALLEKALDAVGEISRQSARNG